LADVDPVESKPIAAKYRRRRKSPSTAVRDVFAVEGVRLRHFVLDCGITVCPLPESLLACREGYFNAEKRTSTAVAPALAPGQTRYRRSPRQNAVAAIATAFFILNCRKNFKNKKMSDFFLEISRHSFAALVPRRPYQLTVVLEILAGFEAVEYSGEFPMDTNVVHAADAVGG
jgi:hypothetical protein